MGQYDSDECMLPMYFHHDATKHGFNHFDAVNRTWIHQKKWHLVICAPKFTVAHTPVSNAASRLAAVIVSEPTVHAAANVIKLFVQILVLQMTLILDS
ncbi:hypothetical protein TNCV_2342991 [Trichonephila clavipes]|nr:hypothetical protein TNCV_2342991 [Trichonephila clavipes]